MAKSFRSDLLFIFKRRIKEVIVRESLALWCCHFDEIDKNDL
jgi:hypothetical protein